MNLYFYIVENEDGKTIKPFILISKYNLKEIKELYKKYNKSFPKIKYLFAKNKASLKSMKTMKQKIYKNKTQKKRKV